MAAPEDSGASPEIALTLLGGFGLTVGGCPVPEGSAGTQRLIAYLALSGGTRSRTRVAATLWPEASEARAHASLRSALVRLGTTARITVQTTNSDICLDVRVSIDLHQARATALRLVESGRSVPPSDLDGDAVACLSRELLPGWYDDWALAESEDWRQLRLHGLEALAARLVLAGRTAEAARAALAAVRAEPLRESAQAALIAVHLAEGNQSEALRSFERYRRLLRSELQLEPTPRLDRLMGGLQTP